MKYLSPQKEEWKDMPGYEGIYQVSDLGRVKSLSKIKYQKNRWRVVPRTYPELILKGFVSRYANVILYNGNGQKSFVGIHRLVAMAFIPNPEEKPQVNHINGIKTDNRLDNLEWVTVDENMQHASKNKLLRFGENNHCSKIILDTETGVYYDTVGAAAKSISICYTTLISRLKNKKYKKFIIA